jgi:hypothetical protein
MSFRKALPFALTAMLSLTFAACGGDKDSDDTTAPTGDTPTQAEVSAMAEALSAIGSIAFAGNGANNPGLAAQSTSYTNSGSCPNGGTTTVTGTFTVTSATQTSTAGHYNVTQVYHNCAATGGGHVYTFNGQGLTLTATYSSSGNAFTYNFSETGNLGWSGNGKSGSCPVDIDLDLTYNANGTYSYDYSGSYCGVSITA